MLETIYTVAEVAKALRVHEETIYKKVREGRIKCADLGPRIVRIPQSEVERLMKCSGER